MDIRTKQKLELLQYIPLYLISILLVTSGGVITFYKIDISQLHSKIGIVEIWFVIFRFFDNLFGTFGVGLFIFSVGCLLCHFLGIDILYNSGLVNRNNKKNKNLVKSINLVIVLIISILLIPWVYKFLIQLQNQLR
jgi:hypothetical protein